VPEDFIHRVGRTGRAGDSGVASTFCTRNERSEIRNIERTLNIRLIRQEVSPELAREERSASIIVMQPKPKPGNFNKFKFKRRAQGR